MSNILKKIKQDLKTAMTREVQFRKDGVKGGDAYDVAISHKNVARAIISMFPSIGVKPGDATDADVIKILKKYIGQEKERTIYELGYLKEKDVEGKGPSEVKKLVKATIEALGDELYSHNIFIAQSYLPKQASVEEITQWITDNVDFSTFKNRMQAMGPIMKHFQGADGNVVKQVLLKM